LHAKNLFSSFVFGASERRAQDEPEKAKSKAPGAKPTPGAPGELLAHVADVDAKDKKGFTVWSMTGDSGVRKPLIQAGAK